MRLAPAEASLLGQTTAFASLLFPHSIPSDNLVHWTEHQNLVLAFICGTGRYVDQQDSRGAEPACSHGARQPAWKWSAPPLLIGSCRNLTQPTQTCALIARTATHDGRRITSAYSFGESQSVYHRRSHWKEGAEYAWAYFELKRQLREYSPQDGHTYIEGVGRVALCGESCSVTFRLQEESDHGYLDEGASRGAYTLGGPYSPLTVPHGSS